MYIQNISCASCGSAIIDGYRSCGVCGAPVNLGGNSESGNLHRIAGTPGRDMSKMNMNLLDTIPRVLAPQPLSQYSDGQTSLQFVSPFASPTYGKDAYGEIGSNNPVSLAYSRRVEYRAIFTSPLFDLRPELGASAGNPGAASINRGGAYGQGARFNVQLERGRTPNSDERMYNYQTIDFTATADPQKLVQTSAPQSVSAAVRNAPIVLAGTNTTTLLSFSPPSNPVRFWQLWFVVDVIANDLVPNALPSQHRVVWWAG